MTRLAALLLVAGTLAACRTPAPIDEPAVGVLRGRIEGAQNFSKSARVQVYRVDDDGIPTPDPFEWAPIDRLGRFTTHVLRPGRYRLVYRSLEGPPSAGAARVPPESRVILRPVVAAGLVQLRVNAAGKDPEPIRCRLTEAEPGSDLPDVREFRTAPDAAAFVRGLRPGRWFLDLPEIGATTELVLPATDALRELELDPPAIEATTSLAGEVRRLDGDGAAWVVVSVRPLTAGGDAGAAWGRFAITDRSGRYEVVGIPPGPSLVRVECREVRYRILPSAQIVSIPPSGRVFLGFVVEP